MHVAQIGLETAPDRAVWEYAGEHGHVLISKDNDFRQLAFFFGPPRKVVWLNVGNVSTAVIEDLLRRNAAMLTEFSQSETESLLVLALTA